MKTSETGRHHRDLMIAELGSNGRRFIVWFNYHWQVFSRFDERTFGERPIES